MSYSKLYFGKELADLTYSDIEQYFMEEKEESDKIEFKSYHNADEKSHKEKEYGILRTICGLLNSEGGLIIWGAPVGKKVEGKSEKVFQGELSPCNMAIGKDSFINKVADSITPSPNAVKFQPIEKNGQFVYVIEVDQSFYSPHQFKNIYYMRMDGQTKPAPHHYIEALFRKVTFPKLDGRLRIDSFEIINGGYQMKILIDIKNLSKLQNEFNLYYKINISEGLFLNNQIDSRNYKVKKKGKDLYERKEVVSANLKETVYYNEAVIISETIYFDPNVFIKNVSECKIELYFGGKSSPLMVSEYILKLLTSQPSLVKMEIVDRNENQYVYEKFDAIE